MPCKLLLSKPVTAVQFLKLSYVFLIITYFSLGSVCSAVVLLWHGFILLLFLFVYLGYFYNWKVISVCCNAWNSNILEQMPVWKEAWQLWWKWAGQRGYNHGAVRSDDDRSCLAAPRQKSTWLPISRAFSVCSPVKTLPPVITLVRSTGSCQAALMTSCIYESPEELEKERQGFPAAL